MTDSRRRFLSMFVVSSASLGLVSYTMRAQETPPKPTPKPQLRDEDTGEPKIDSKAMLEANQKDMRKSIERLFLLASELKAEVEKTDSVQVLSVPMLKKAEEIEKLAKSIRSHAIG